MSFVGKNIRKIRSVKNYSQTEFADKFALKRATVGAYEEGRSEPKIATLVEIANYFSIKVDDLLQKELSVNDLYQFDIFKKELQGNRKHNLRPSQESFTMLEIPFVTLQNWKEYWHGSASLNEWPQLALPLRNRKDLMAFELPHGLGEKPQQAQIVVAGGAQKATALEGPSNPIYLFESEHGPWLARVLNTQKDQVLLQPFAEEAYPVWQDINALKQVWQVELYIANNIGNASGLRAELRQLKQQVEGLALKQASR